MSIGIIPNAGLLINSPVMCYLIAEVTVWYILLWYLTIQIYCRHRRENAKMIDSELAQKLVELKFYGEQYDLAIALMCTAKTQQEVVAHWKRSNEFEEKYLCAWDWLT